MTETIAVTGGKGGTGKSTIATALAFALSKEHKVLLVDADVDCPNDHLLLGIERKLLKIVEQRTPVFDMGRCTKCGACGKVCKTNALVSIKGKEPVLLEQQCNGCGACEIACPAKAISWGSKEIGRIYTGKKDGIDVLSGELKENQPVSEFVVNSLNKEISMVYGNYDYIIIDTAAGTHCPVIAAVEHADKVLAVTEPTPLGAHDLKVILQLLDMMRKEWRIILNRSDIGDKRLIESIACKHKTSITFEIPFSKEIIESYSNGEGIEISEILHAIK